MAYTAPGTFYDVLELNTSASRNDIKDAYKKMALKRHPDKNPDDKRAVAKFQEVKGDLVQQAYETLYDNDKRVAYDVKKGLNKSLPLRPTFCTGTASSSATANPYNPPSAPERPDSFWSEVPKPKRSECPPKPKESREGWKMPADWSGPSEESKQDWFEEWQKGEEQRQKQHEEIVARKLDKQRKKMEAKIPNTLVVILALIRRLAASIDKMETENKDADVIIDEWVGMEENETEFFEKIYQRNVKLNSLRRELEIEMKEYRMLYKRLKTFDPKKGEEAERIYRHLKKKTTQSQEKERSDLGGCEVQDQKVKDKPRRQHEVEDIVKEEIRCQAEDREKAYDKFSRQVEEIEKVNEEHRCQEAKQRKEAKYRVQQEEQMRMNRPSSPEQTSMPDVIMTNEPITEVDNATVKVAYQDNTPEPYGADDEYGNDEEVILLQCRLIHGHHPEVKGELWDIAEGWHVCCYCGNTLTVFECPKYEQCGLRACENCRKDH